MGEETEYLRLFDLIINALSLKGRRPLDQNAQKIMLPAQWIDVEQRAWCLVGIGHGISSTDARKLG